MRLQPRISHHLPQENPLEIRCPAWLWQSQISQKHCLRRLGISFRPKGMKIEMKQPFLHTFPRERKSQEEPEGGACSEKEKREDNSINDML